MIEVDDLYVEGFPTKEEILSMGYGDGRRVYRGETEYSKEFHVLLGEKNCSVHIYKSVFDKPTVLVHPKEGHLTVTTYYISNICITYDEMTEGDVFCSTTSEGELIDKIIEYVNQRIKL